MQMTTFLTDYTGRPLAQLFGPPAMVSMERDGEGTLTFSLWAVPGVTKPTPDQIAAAEAAPEPVTHLATLLSQAASIASSSIVTAIVPDQTHQNAYSNAALIVGPAAAVPTVEPAKTAFANMAAASGMQPQAFATLVTAISAISMQLSATLATLQASCSSAASVNDLKAALTAFETSIALIVSEIEAAGVTITAPAAIEIAGLNA